MASPLRHTRRRTSWVAWPTGLRARTASAEDASSTATATTEVCEPSRPNIRIYINTAECEPNTTPQTSKYTAPTSRQIPSPSRPPRRKPASPSSTTHAHPPVAEDSDAAAAQSLAVDADSGVGLRSVEGGAPSSASAAVAAETSTTTAVDVVAGAAVALAGGTTSRSATVMRRCRSSLSGLSWRRLTSRAWPS